MVLRASSRVIRRLKTDQEGHGEALAIARQHHLPCEGRPYEPSCRQYQGKPPIEDLI
jgi:hypothetical protein